MASELQNLFDDSLLGMIQDSLLEAVLDNSPLVYWAVDTDGIVQISRGAGLRELNKKDGDSVGQSIYDMYADHPHVLRYLEESFQGKSFHTVLQLNDLTVEAWYQPVKDNSGKVLGVVGISLVLTELLKTRSGSDDSGHCFEVLKRLANAGVFRCNAQGEILFANDYFWSCFSLIESGKQFGRELNDSRKGIFWQSLFCDENNQELESSHQALVKHGEFRRELKPIHPNGEVEWVLIQLNCMAVDEWVGTVVDITAMKQAEELFGLQRRELEKAVQARTMELVDRNNQLSTEIEKRNHFAEELNVSQNNMESIMRSTVDLILHLDREGRIQFINHTMTGYDIEKVIGTSLFSWIEPGYEGLAESALQIVFEKKEYVAVEIPTILADGSKVLFSMRWGPIFNQGQEVVGLTVVARDITHERELEVEAKQRLDEISHLTRLGMLGEIAATVSHELKQPLLAIGNYATGCSHRLNDRAITEDQVSEVLHLISELSLRARKIVHQTQEFATKKELKPVRVSVQDLLKKSLELVQTELTRDGILLKNELDGSVPDISFDVIQGQQVMVNLLLNAIKAIGRSKKEITHAITVRSAMSEGDFIQLTLADTADGIEDKSAEGVFEMFHSSNAKGLGMGLAISRRIVERHGGKLRVLHTGDQGTIFEILLPIFSESLGGSQL